MAIKKKLFSEFNVHTIIRLPASVFAPYTSITTNIIFFDNTGTTKETYFYRLDMPEEYKHFSKTKPMKLEHFADCINGGMIDTIFKMRILILIRLKVLYIRRNRKS